MADAGSKKMPDRRQIGLFYVGLAILTIGLYSRVLGFNFLNFDDQHYVYQNSHVTAGLTAQSVSWAFTTSFFDFWHPLTWLSHMLDCELFGLSPGLHHLVNVLFHAANTLF